MQSLIPATTFPPAPDAFNMAAYVLAHAQHQPDKPALQVVGATGTQTFSYSALSQAIMGTAAGLLAHGFVAGDRILLRLGNTPDFPILYLACIAVDLIPIPTSSQLTTAEITVIADQTAPTAVICGPSISRPDHAAPILPLSQTLPWRDLPGAAFTLGDPNRAAYIIYTSGTSGVPRAVVHAHRAVWARQMMWQGWYDLRPNDRLLHAGAFNWSYTLGTGLMDPWAIGATALIPAPDTPTTDLSALLATQGATLFAAAPGVYRQMLRHPMPALPELRHGLSAGEKLPDATLQKWITATGTHIHEAFGMSECSTFISGNPANPAPTDTLGYVQPGRQVALIGPDGPADHGTIAVHRDDPGLMLGYLDQPTETASRFSGDWFLSGDIATRTGGAIRYEGRNDDMMNAGGYRVSPIEVETALATHPAITESAACTVTVKPGTQVIAAFYTGPDVIDDTQLNSFAASRLARYKCPRLFVHVTSLPRGTNNKLLRRQLRIQWETENGQT